MGDIYRSGKQTLVWLGDADHWTGRAFRLLKLRSSQASKTSDSSELCDEPRDEHGRHRGYTGAKGCHRRHLRLVWDFCRNYFSRTSLISFTCRPYFERAWIVQELVLSDNAVVMCGKHEITRHELFDWLHESQWLPAEGHLIRGSIVDLRLNPEQYCLEAIVSKLSHTKTSDPRDKLYSALGLHQNCLSCGSIVVDYTKDADEVFLDATKILLSRSPFLDILSMGYCTSHPDGRDVPSWVWNPEPRHTRSHLSRAEANATNPFQATQLWHSRPQFRGRMLGLLGYAFDNVRTVGNVLPTAPSRWTQSEFLEAIRCYFSWVDISGIHEQGITDAEADFRICAFRCTLKPLKEKLFTRGSKLYSNWVDDEDARNFESFHAILMNRFSKFLSPGAKEASIRARLGLWMAIQSFYWHFSFDNVSAKSWFDFVRYRDSEAVFGRCFVTAGSGAYGLCPPGTMPNDRLVLLQGGNVPYVLRPSGSNWTLIGECFMYGAMYGELWDQDRCEMLWIE